VQETLFWQVAPPDRQGFTLTDTRRLVITAPLLATNPGESLCQNKLPRSLASLASFSSRKLEMTISDLVQCAEYSSEPIAHHEGF